MSIPYVQIAKSVLLRSGQVADAVSAAALETVFTNAALASVVGGVEVPLTALKYTILASEKRIAALCARQENPLLRDPLYAVSANIAHKGVIPVTDSNSKEWVGNFISVFDASTSEPLTEKPKQTVMRHIRQYDSGFLKIRPMHYAVDGRRVFHTRANVYFEGCSWDYTTQATAYDLPAAPLADLVFVAADVNTTNNTIAETSHPYYTGLAMQVIKVGLTLPVGTGFTDGAIVFAIWDTSGTIKVATTLANALIGTAIDFTNAGSGTHTLRPQAQAAGTSPLAQELEVMFIADVLANLAQEGWFADEAGRYASIVQKCEADVKGGIVPSAVLPDSSVHTDPVKN